MSGRVGAGMLKGLRLLDLSSRLPGPLCSLILSDLGMEVIRVEPPEHLKKGDLFREIPEPRSPYFAMLNRGKKSVTLNLKTARGREIFLGLVKRSDVVLEGFRPGVMERLGIGYEVLKSVNPGIILASISGYGQAGPYRERAGHDLNYLAYSGVLALNAPPGGGLPVMPPVQIADVGGGSYPAAVGILAALIERNRTGEGRWLDVSMLDGSVFCMALALFDWGIGKPIAPGIPPISWGAVHYNVYETKDGKFLALGALEENFWQAFCEVMEKPEWTGLYEDGEAMRDPALIGELREIFLTKTRQEWLSLFEGHDICLSPVYSFEEVDGDPHVRARDIFRWKPLESGGRIPAVRFPVWREGSSPWDQEPPERGQHNRDLLGVTEEELETLKREGVV